VSTFAAGRCAPAALRRFVRFWDAWYQAAVEGACGIDRAGATSLRQLRSYKQAAEDHVLPELGPKKLSALERIDCQGLVQLLMAADLSPQTIRNAMMPLRVICRDADLVIGAAAGEPDVTAAPPDDGEERDAVLHARGGQAANRDRTEARQGAMGDRVLRGPAPR
jgi:hypothetical protein